jgi:hypothetical protein
LNLIFAPCASDMFPNEIEERLSITIISNDF